MKYLLKAEQNDVTGTWTLTLWDDETGEIVERMVFKDERVR